MIAPTPTVRHKVPDLRAQQAIWEAEAAADRGHAMIRQIRTLHRLHAHETMPLAAGLTLCAAALTLIWIALP